MARMATMKASRCRQRVTGQGERLIRLTMVLFYGQTISVRYIIRQFDVSPRTGPRSTGLCAGIRWPSPLATGSLAETLTFFSAGHLLTTPYGRLSPLFNP